MSTNLRNDAVPVVLHIRGREEPLAVLSITQAAGVLGALTPFGVHKEVVNFLRKHGFTLCGNESHPLHGLRVEALAQPEEGGETPPTRADKRESPTRSRRSSREPSRNAGPDDWCELPF